MCKRSWRCLIKGGLSSDLLESKSSHEMSFMSLDTISHAGFRLHANNLSPIVHIV